MYGTFNVILGAIVVIAIFMGFALLKLILRGAGLYQIGKREGRTDGLLAFIPYLNVYFMGELSGPIVIYDKKIERPGLWALVISVVTGIVGVVFRGMSQNVITSKLGGAIDTIIGAGYDSDVFSYFTGGSSLSLIAIVLLLVSMVTALASAVVSALRTLMMYQIYLRFNNQNVAVFHAVCGVFVPFYEAICIFIMSKKPYLQGTEPQSTY